MNLLLLIGIVGIITGFLSGLLGIGGGILMAPLLLYLPQLLGFEPLTMQTVAGLTIVQGLVACISGGLTHRRFRFLSGSLAGWMGISLFIAAFLGGIGSKFVSNEILLLIFAVMAFVAAVMILPRQSETEYPDVDEISFSRFKAVQVSGVVGFLGGMVGQGGSFLLIPVMTAFMKIPTRIAIGTNLGIVFLSTLAGFIGKAVTGQIAWSLAMPIVLTAVPAAFLGGSLSRKISVDDLRIILAVIIAVAAVRIGFSAAGY